MKRRKNLERAIVLGLLLSTSVYGSAWAMEYPTGITESGTYDEVSTIYTNPLTGKAVDADGNKVITVNGESITIDVNSDLAKQYGISVTGAQGKVSVNADNGIKFNLYGQGSTSSNNVYGVNATSSSNVELITKKGNIEILGGDSDNRFNDTLYRGINASGGSITLDAEKGDIILKSYTAKDAAPATTFKDNVGIYASKNVNLNANNVEIDVDASEGIAKGIYTLNKSGIVDINADNNVNITAKGEEAYGIYTYGLSSTVDINAGNNISISAIAEKTSSNNSSYGSYAISSSYHTINLDAGNNLYLSADSTDLNRAFGFWVANQGKTGTTLNTINADNIVNIGADLTINDYATSSATAAGIYEQGNGEIPQTTNVTAGQGINIIANAKNNLTNKQVNAYGIYAQTTTLNVKTGVAEVQDQKTPNINIGAVNNSKNSSSVAYGIYAYHSDKLAHQTTINNNNGSTYIYGIGEDKASGKGIVMDVFNSQTTDNKIDVTSKYNNIVYGTHGAVQMHDEQSDLKINSIKGNNCLSADSGAAADIDLGADLNMIAESGINSLVSEQTTGLNIKNNGSTAILTGYGNYINGKINGITASDSSDVSLTANNGANNIISGTTGISANNSEVTLTTNDNDTVGTENEIYSNNIEGASTGINATNSNVVIDAIKGSNAITGTSAYGVYSYNSDVDIQAQEINNITSNSYGIYASVNAQVDIISNTLNNINAGQFGIVSYDGTVNVNAGAGSNLITGKNYSIYAAHNYSGYENNKIILDGKNNILKSDNGIGIYSSDDITIVDLDADANNTIYAGELAYYDSEDGGGIYGSKKAIDARSGSTVSLDAGEANALSGAVYATGAGTTVDLISTGEGTYSNNNDIRSAATIANAGGLTDTTVISALYAENGANISVSGERNVIRTYADYDKPEELERVVWAYDTADITIDGATIIGTDTYEKSSNSNDIAIAAGTATGLTGEIVSAPVEDRATVTLTYDNFKTNDGREATSSITGDILSAYEGLVDIKAKDGSNAGVNITGNLLAGNNGILNVNLGNGGVLTGRADDYGDAGANEAGFGSGNDGHQSLEFFDPAFSSDIYKGGEVNLTMGDNSRWNVTGQSWITSITTSDEEETAENNHIIDLISANTDRNETAHALTVYNFDGNATFNMSLDADRDVSDMLYIKNADGNYIVNVIDAVTEEDMYAARTDGGTFDGLRFATVGKDSTASFRAITYDAGFNNVEYIIGSDSYDESTENHHYNGTELTSEKPGDTTVDEFFENNGTPGSTTEATNGIAKASFMALAANETGNTEAGTAENDDLTDVEVNTNETTNFKLIGVKNTELSDGGKTMLNMSRANYSNAIYMDRLNKRLGEARYINSEEEDGMWVRIRHDRIGKTDAYRSQNTMYELGYDKKQDCDNGERRVGFAVDYMHGDTGYSDIAGKGEIDRYGLWLYDTWMGNKGHYVDYVAKWGHLDNEFEIYNSRGQVTGDYSNNVFSVSAEYGRKKDMGNDWYIEPQAQLQLARVTGADYVTSQGTKVSVDGINSLIGRAGFRLGKDFGEEKQSTVYFKADVLHEFLGDQDISALDATTNGSWDTISYENEGTWYDVGFGFATMMSKNSYAFLDLEKSFGHDNDETYQINAGVQWTF